MVASREGMHLDIEHPEPVNERVVDAQETRQAREWSPGGCRSPAPLPRDLDGAIGQASAEPTIRRPHRSRVEIADQRAGPVGGIEVSLQSPDLGAATGERLAEWQHMWRREVDIDDLHPVRIVVPCRHRDLRHARIPETHGKAPQRRGLPQRHAHAGVVARGLQRAEREQALKNAGLMRGKLLRRHHVRRERLDEAGHARRARTAVGQVHREHAEATRARTHAADCTPRVHTPHGRRAPGRERHG